MENTKVYVVTYGISGSDYQPDMPVVLGVFTELNEAKKCLVDFANNTVQDASKDTEHNLEDVMNNEYFELTDFSYDEHVYADIQEVELQ